MAPIELEVNNEYSYQLLEKSDPNLALAGLRLEIEMRLRRIAHDRSLEISGLTASRTVLKLVDKDVFKKHEGEVILELLRLLDLAVHGAKVDKLVIEWVNDVGPRILHSLDQRRIDIKIDD